MVKSMVVTKKGITRAVLLGVVSLTLAGCVVEPYPGPGPVAVAQPCCYGYPQYPGYYAEPAVGVEFGGYGGRGWGGGGRRWR